MRFPRRRDWWLLAGGLLLLLVFALGSRGLNEPDEGRYADIAAAMTQPGASWWEPRLSGFAHYDKPPLIYWAAALSVRAFGRNEWAVRLPSLLGAMLGLTGLGWAAARLYGSRVAWWAVLVCGTSVQYWALGRVLTPDMLLTGWCTLAVAAWAECRHRGGAWSFWCLSLLFWTLAWWTKATPALIPLAGLAIGGWLTGDTGGRRALRLWLLVGVLLLLGSPWYLSMLHTHPELTNFFFGRELAGRLAGSVDGRRASRFYYIPVSLVAWLPWWPLSAWAWWRQRKQPPAAGSLPPDWPRWYQRISLEGWIVLSSLVIFSLSSSKLPTYTLPLAPWAALLLARPLASIGASDESGLTRRWLLAPAAALALVAIAVSLILPQYEAALGVNSSIRDVCRFLLTRGAQHIDFDHYWAGAEFYLPPGTVRYVIPHDRQQERASDPGLYPGLFIEPDTWLDLTAGDVRAPGERLQERWLVRFSRQKGTAFEALFDAVQRSANPERIIRIGNFRLLRTRAASASTGKPAVLDENAGSP